jgi:hypothetical protein
VSLCIANFTLCTTEYKPEGCGYFSFEVTQFFNWTEPSSRTIGLGSIHPLTPKSTMNLLGGKVIPALKGKILITICEPII